MKVFLCGHGSWSASGFASLPKKTTLRVYTPVGRYLGLDQAQAIMSGESGALRADQVFKEYESATDLTLHPCPEFKDDFQSAADKGGGTLVMVAMDTKLSKLLTQYEGNDLHWLACRARFGSKDTTEGGLNEDFRPGSGMGIDKMAENVDKIRSDKVGTGGGQTQKLSELQSNPAFNRARHRSGL